MSRQQLPVVERLIEKSGEVKTFLKARLAFVGFPELFAYAAGLTKISFSIFIMAYMVVHAISASLLVVFGNLIVSGDLKALISVAIISWLFAAAGAWWLHADLTRGN